ncbi:hypothetical protein EPD60_00380 [Flaviaesturariibacter flavus]|uniref:DUF2478 domain-containing protein n=1 Tax=Flaviaesturariibacter flavus TaxID=2502780 RepID=A0A4R1BR13_9BACT|nr:hypothetical protein [Flaviaesturariibacter flavus]TCJ19615.1 hypothetical protein EPD60_00380 [Flaviaesturariibacter flavus]
MTVFIFSRPIRSGKTTDLLAWSRGGADVRGIAMPDYNGERHFEDLATGERWSATAGTETDLLPAGPFRFSKEAFAKAARRLELPEGGWLIVDEIGKLELEGKGFANALERVIADGAGTDFKLLLVVRDTLLEKVCSRFGLGDARVLHELGAL